MLAGRESRPWLRICVPSCRRGRGDEEQETWIVLSWLGGPGVDDSRLRSPTGFFVSLKHVFVFTDDKIGGVAEGCSAGTATREENRVLRPGKLAHMLMKTDWLSPQRWAGAAA